MAFHRQSKIGPISGVVVHEVVFIGYEIYGRMYDCGFLFSPPRSTELGNLSLIAFIKLFISARLAVWP